MSTPTSTYRLQLHAGFGFSDAEAIVPYLARLGVSHLYLSPILQSVPQSMHGYDVLDHTEICAELGGRTDFESLARAAHAHDLGIVVDVVPNHMAFPAPEYRNRPLWQVLAEGRDAATAEWFDVDWKAGGGRLGLAVLGDSLDAVIESGELHRDEMEIDGVSTPVIRYHDHVLPIALGTEGGPETTVREILDRQHYRLTSWRDKADVLNYRRFFEVDGLIAVRVELEEVFTATHALLLELNHAGLIDGFRIDHPDGLADPAAYLKQLRSASRRGTWIVVEKILEGDEALPTSWACDGTTGYDALKAIQSALVDTADADVITQEWAATGGLPSLEDAVIAAKRQVIDQSLVPEVERLHRRAREVLPELDPARLRAAIIELLVAGEVYRAYVRPDQRLSATARERLEEAFAAALAAAPELAPELHALGPLTVVTDEDNAAMVDFAVRLQQTWGPVMAKGIEDTTFYRWHRLIALNEVGGDPDALVTGGPHALHAWSTRQAADWSTGMTTLSTHDTKRSEATRARILAVAGDPVAWAECSRRSRELAAAEGLDAPTAHFIWQTLAGVTDISAERLDAYLLKAVREGKEHTAWVDGDAEYEEHVRTFATAIRADETPGSLHEAVLGATRSAQEAIRATTLAAKTLLLTIPGVPDTYQGCELADLSLVDPDNRRPVDYAARVALLDRLDAGESLDEDGLDGELLALTATLLRLRKALPEVFGAGSSYEPLETGTEHAIAFRRGARRHTLAEVGGAVAGAIGGVLGGVLSGISELTGIGGDANAGVGHGAQATADGTRDAGDADDARAASSQPQRPDDRSGDAVITIVTRAPARLAATGGWGAATITLPEGDWRDELSGLTHSGQVRFADLFTHHPVAVLVGGGSRG